MLTSMKNRVIAKVITRFPSVAKRFVEAYEPVASRGEIPWAELAKPLRACKIAVVTTAGVHHRGQAPFDMKDPDGDPGYRELDVATIRKDFTITHDYYDHADAERDLNIVLPLDRLEELLKEGILGSLSERHFGFMGHIDGRHIPTLIETSAREVAGKLLANNVDLVLLTPA